MLQSSYPDEICCFNINWRFRWKILTSSALMISCGNLLYTQISPSTLLLSISKKGRSRISISCLLCSLPPDLVFRRSVVAGVKKSLKCRGPLPRVHRWINPNIAISRLLSRGAKLYSSSASSRDMPSSAKKLSCSLFNGEIAVLHAC